jgi:hypothetical protein
MAFAWPQMPCVIFISTSSQANLGALSDFQPFIPACGHLLLAELGLAFSQCLRGFICIIPAK